MPDPAAEAAPSAAAPTPATPPATLVQPEVAAVLAPAEPEPEVEGDWSRVTVVAHGKIPTDIGKRKVIVAEYRTQPTVVDNEITVQAELKTQNYPKGADAYYRTDESVSFNAGDAPVFTMGGNLRPKGVGGFAPRGAGGLRTGPGDPAYAAANLAYQKGATDIVISGLSEAEQDRLSPWFADKRLPDGVSITFS